MNTTTYDALEAQSGSLPRGAVQWLWLAACSVWKLALGILLSTSLFLSVLVVGWTARLMQRTALKSWWRRHRQPFRKMLRFRDVATGRPGWVEHAGWPNWLVSQSIGDDLRRGQVHRLLGGLWLNFRIGVQMAFNTGIILIIPCLMWSFSWFAGWQVSFNKVYEYFANGMALGWTGILLFVVAMFYVPMAQARQAVSGEWRAFYDFRLIRRIIRRRWFLCALLATGYAVTGFVIMILMSIPMSPELQDYLNTLPPEKQVQIGKLYFLGAAVFIFPAYVALRWWAARIYASAVSQMMARGEIKPEELSPAERLGFPPEVINAPDAAAEWRRRDAVLSWTLSAPFRFGAGVLVFFAWLVFVFEIYIAQFFVYRGPRVWFNHPLVQLPWSDYTPSSHAEPR